MLETLLIFLAVGAVAGLTAGLFGVGGGMIIVPALAFMLPGLGVGDAIVMQVAVGTSLAVISATSISSMLAHHRRGAVLWDVFKALTVGLIIGALIGAVIADHVSSLALRRIVGVSALLVAIKMWLDLKPKAHTPLPGPAGLTVAGGLIGSASSLIGIGGGSLTVPFLSWCSVPMQKAVGTAAAGGIPIAWAGMLGFMITGWGEPGLPDWSLGYVSLPGFLGIAIASVSVAPLGARLAHTLSPHMLKRCFAILLFVIGIEMSFF
ncbi:MAG: sulfite exporter TauE/SafE family protein [Salinisphaeraceae bacterium]|nr:sulfite exporter TauE/SafE family protein [Salinisphaeraceae bacterium]